MSRAHLPRPTVRLRLTLLCGGLFLASGAVLLLIITGVFWGSTTSGKVTVSGAVIRNIAGGLPFPGQLPVIQYGPPPGFQLPAPNATPTQLRVLGGQLRGIAVSQRMADLHLLVLFSGLAIAVMAVLALALGWWMAGRVLRPLRTMTTAVRHISATNLHERLELGRPDDELKELGDTFDDLLERLDGSFQAQRQFVANASHELRTPLATMRASVDVATAKPGGVPEQTAVLAGRLRDELDHMERLLESLLVLARAQRGAVSDQTTMVLDTLTAASLSAHAEAILGMELEVDSERCPDAVARGSVTLLSRMIDNLVDNAVKHNERGGWVRIRTEVDGGRIRFVVENGGAQLDEASVVGLAQPFRRLGAERTGSENGTGIGLSIVASVAEAHGGTLTLHAREGGGFRAVVELPLAVPVAIGESAGAPA